MNEILWLLTLVFAFVSIILCYKYLGKTGLLLWIAIATIIANIQTIKIVKLFGLETSLGTILYGSTFLATDILNFKYGVKESRKSIIYGFVAMITMTLFMIICLLYKPSVNDFSQESLLLIFSFNVRITLASLCGFGISQFIDTYLFDKLQKKYNKLWLSNNGSTLICQMIDTIVFCIITYIGTIDAKSIVQIMISMYIFKFIVSLFDTPFMYFATKVKSVKND